MSHIVITRPNEVPRKYPIPDGFTYRELNTIKTITGLRPADFEEALSTGDPGIVISLAMICAARAGHALTEDDLLDLEVGAIMVEGDEEDPTPADADEAVEASATETTPEAGGTQPSLASTASAPGN